MTCKGIVHWYMYLRRNFSCNPNFNLGLTTSTWYTTPHLYCWYGTYAYEVCELELEKEHEMGTSRGGHRKLEWLILSTLYQKQHKNKQTSAVSHSQTTVHVHV